MLIMGMTAPEIRVLQEYRRIGVDALDLAAIKAIKHPAGGGEAPAVSLVSKGFLRGEDGGQKFGLTDKAREFLAIDAKPESEASAPDEPAAQA